MAKGLKDISGGLNIKKSECVNCGICADNCPQGVFEMQNGNIVVVRPDDCVHCKNCVESCPVNAITLE